MNVSATGLPHTKPFSIWITPFCCFVSVPICHSAYLAKIDMYPSHCSKQPDPTRSHTPLPNWVLSSFTSISVFSSCQSVSAGGCLSNFCRSPWALIASFEFCLSETLLSFVFVLYSDRANGYALAFLFYFRLFSLEVVVMPPPPRSVSSSPRGPSWSCGLSWPWS